MTLIGASLMPSSLHSLNATLVLILGNWNFLIKFSTTARVFPAAAAFAQLLFSFNVK